MVKLIGFELNKMLRSKKNIIAIIFMFVLLLLMSDNIVAKALGYADYNSYMSGAISVYTTRSNLTDSYEIESNKKTSELLNGYLVNNNYMEFLKWEINYQQKEIDRLKLTKNFSRDDQVGFNIIEADKYWIENNIEPEEALGSDKSVFVVSKFSSGFPVYFILFLLLFVADIFNKEYQTGSVKLLMTQPFKRKDIVLSKYFASVIFSLSVVGAMLLSMFIFIGIKNGFGDPNTPVEVTNNFLIPTVFSPYKYNILVPLWQQIILSISLIVAAILAFNAIALFLTTVVKNRGITISALVVAVIAFYYITFKYYSLPLDPFNIFATINIENDLSAAFESIDKHIHISFMDALLSFLIYSGLFSTLSVYIVKRKSITA